MNNNNEAKEKFNRLNFNPNNLPFFEIHEPTGHCNRSNRSNWNEIMKLMISSLIAVLLIPPLTRSNGNVTWIKAREVVISNIDNIINIEFLFHFFWSGIKSSKG